MQHITQQNSDIPPAMYGPISLLAVSVTESCNASRSLFPLLGTEVGAAVFVGAGVGPVGEVVGRLETGARVGTLVGTDG